MSSYRFHPGAGSPKNIPLSRFFPHYSQSVVSSWLAENVPTGSLVIDPFGSSPQMLIEIAQAGYRVISVLKNPITRFVVDVLTSAPQKPEMQTAVAELASTKRGSMRLEPYLLSIYETKCGACDAKVSADAFLWDQKTNAPYAKIYTCSFCGQQGEYPTDENDIQLAAEFTTSGPDYYQALDRIAQPGSPNRKRAKIVLEHFSNRAIHAVLTLINRIESMDITERETEILEALVLTTLDKANKLWPVKELDKRPLRVYTPGHYKEVNIWKALEGSLALWNINQKPIETSIWPEIPKSDGGICIYPGKVSNLIGSGISKEIKAAVTIFPRLNPAFWSFSAIWAGWLWSKKTNQSFINILNHRRFDWAWHCSALTDTTNLLAKIMQPNTKFFGLIADIDSQFNNAVVLAGSLGGFTLESSSPRPDEDQIQLVWNRGDPEQAQFEYPLPDEITNKSAKEYLLSIEEPSSYIHLQFAALEGLTQNFSLSRLGKTTQEIYNQLDTIMKINLSSQNGILRFGGSDRNPEEGKRWIDQEHHSKTPLSDQVEQSVFNELAMTEQISLEEMDIKICSSFPGNLTPSRIYINQILKSYAIQTQSGNWVLRDEDLPQNRDADVEMIIDLLRSIGNKLGYLVKDDEGLSWWTDNMEKYRFYVLPNAMISPILTQPLTKSFNKVIVLPGSRTELVMHKLEEDPRLPKILARDWRFVKFRQIRLMSLAQTIQLNNIDQFFDDDPMEETDSQLSLL